MSCGLFIRVLAASPSSRIHNEEWWTYRPASDLNMLMILILLGLAVIHY